jgi:hypothetical protein
LIICVPGSDINALRDKLKNTYDSAVYSTDNLLEIQPLEGDLNAYQYFDNIVQNDTTQELPILYPKIETQGIVFKKDQVSKY